MYDPLIALRPGAYLARCADVESKLGESEKRFHETTFTEYIIPLKAFLEVDMKNVLVGFI